MEVRVLSSALYTVVMAPEIFIIVVFFVLIGKAADIVIEGLRSLAEALRINLFLAGVLLGVFTSAPEITIGINALALGVPAITFGNLIGGTLILFGPILGLSIILNRRVATDGTWGSILPITLYLTLPLLYGIDGVISSLDGIILIFGYLVVLYYTYRSHEHAKPKRVQKSDTVTADVLTIIMGLVGVFVCATFIIRYTELLLTQLSVPPFLVGLIAFSIGTNLPELTVTIRSWQKHIKDLSISTLIGSALTNGLTIGAFALMVPLVTTINSSYLAIFVGNAVLMAALSLAYRSGKSFTHTEGIFLVIIYIITIGGATILGS